MSLHTFESFFNRKKDVHPYHRTLLNLGWDYDEKTNTYNDIHNEVSVMFSYFGQDSLFWKDGAHFPIGRLKGLDTMGMPFESLENFPRIIGEYGFISKNLKIEDFTSWKPEMISGRFDVAFSDTIKNLKGLENTIMHCDLLIDHCESLTSLEGCPQLSNNVLTIEGCKNLKDLSGLQGVQLLSINFDNTSISLIERSFVKNSLFDGIENYWKELYFYLVRTRSYDMSYDINWPKDFFDTLPTEYKNAYNSKRAINKFNL